MEALIQEGLQGGRPAELVTPAGPMSVNADVWDALASQRGSMGEQIQIRRDAQHGGWVAMSARFDTGYVLNCYFYGASPIVVERCSGDQRTRR